MKSIYKYMVLAVALMLSATVVAQERVDEKLVYYGQENEMYK